MGEIWSKMAYQVYRRSISWGYSTDYEVRGLFNYNLSCCVNSLLQSFSATTELLEVLNKWSPSGRIEPSNIPLQLRNTLLFMRDKSHPAPHRDFLNCLYSHGIRRYTQQDADEIFHVILNLVQTQLSDHDLAHEIRSLYEIKVETQVTCSDCKYIHQVPSSYFSLPLAIFEGENTLESCINSFFKRQNLNDREKHYCDRCEMKQPSTHELKLISLPPILCVNLKRFRNDRGYPRKLYNRVTFPESFNTDIFAAGRSENVTSESPPSDYSLFAVIVHIGSVMWGHYTALIRPTQDQPWSYADDSSVKPATWENVQDTYKGDNTAYLLLYRRTSMNLSG